MRAARFLKGLRLASGVLTQATQEETMRMLILIALWGAAVLGQAAERFIPRDSVWVETVRAGRMPLRVAVHGTVVSTSVPARVAVAVPTERADRVHAGQSAIVQIGHESVEGTVVSNNEIELKSALPAGTQRGARVDASIHCGELEKAVFVGLPVGAHENGEGVLFRVDEDGQSATLVKVRYGRSSADLIEIRDGLRPGDRVILSDMGGWRCYDRVRLE